MKVWRERIGGIDRYLLGEFEGRARNKVMWNVGAKNRPQVFFGATMNKGILVPTPLGMPYLVASSIDIMGRLSVRLCVSMCLCV